ncbi:MAG: hypothetical protein P1U68_05370 [Verrucomicrobiales bacterium]|nr:hypothetical protein [Verrucomicrobiales bacterium]
MAVVLIGLCAVAMSRLGAGGAEIDSASVSGSSGENLKPSRRALTSTATFEVAARNEDGINLLPQGRAIADQLNDPEGDPGQDLLVVDELIRIHLSAFKTIPQGGENVDIMQSMTGRNAGKLAIIPPGHRVLNETGELIDRWGTPYHFHPVSRALLEIRSAGPDRHLWTDDDILLEGQDSFQ